MYQKILHLIKYHNAIVIVFIICFFGFGISFAATPRLRGAIYSSEEVIVSVDNSAILSVNLNNFDPRLVVGGITEDEENYYVDYSYRTFLVEDNVWQQKLIEKTLTVNKEALGGKDLGLYVIEELGENIDYELAYLKRVQDLEKEKGESQKMITTEYYGIIGKLLDSKTKVIAGYEPVIPELKPVLGCMDAGALNYNPDATENNGSCEYPEPEPIIVADNSESAYAETMADNPGSEEIVFEPEPESELEPEELEPELKPEEIVPEPETTSTPEVILELEPEATSTPEIIESEPEPETTSTPETIEPEPEPESEEVISEPEPEEEIEEEEPELELEPEEEEVVPEPESQPSSETMAGEAEEDVL